MSTPIECSTGHVVETRNLIHAIVCSLVDEPEAVVVELKELPDGALLRLTVAPGDVGKVIGKQGRTARSIRTILSAVSMKTKIRFSLDIVENHERREVVALSEGKVESEVVSI